jgi:signal transduction histidine kinase
LRGLPRRVPERTPHRLSAAHARPAALRRKGGLQALEPRGRGVIVTPVSTAPPLLDDPARTVMPGARAWLLALLLGLLVAGVLAPIFSTPFPMLLGRTLTIAVLLLLAFTLAGRIPPRWLPLWLPRWLAQVSAVVLCAPLAALLVYAVVVGGDLVALFRNHYMVSGLLFIGGAALMVGPLIALGALYRERDAQARAQELQFALERSTLERQALDAQLRLLQAQVQPHFLFNTLANVQALVESGSPRAAPVLRQLTAYLRAAVPRLAQEASTLGDELALVRAYLELMQLRMPDRLTHELDVPADLLRQRFPPMAWITLVENAIRHGIDPAEVGGRVAVGASRDGPWVRAWVADTGVGLAETAREGVGLTNLRRRLAAFFGSDARLELSAVAPHGLRAELVFRADEAAVLPASP